MLLSALIAALGSMAVLQPAPLTIAELPALPKRAVRTDWLVRLPDARAGVYRTPDSTSIVLDNGLVRRTLRFQPAVATVGIENLMTRETMLRAASPEGWVELDGRRWEIGGLSGERDRAYLLPEWIAEMKPNPNGMTLAGWSTGKPSPRIGWKRTRNDSARPWPPAGASLTLTFVTPADAPSVAIDVRYEIYDGLPVIAKKLTLRNTGQTPVRLNRFASESLAFTEAESAVGPQPSWRMPNVHVGSTFMFGGDTPENATKVVHWLPDPAYSTQVNYALSMPAILECRPPIGPDVVVQPGGTFEGFWTYLLLHDSTGRERQGLAVRRMYRTLAPWIEDSPLMLHLTSTDETVARTAIDQAADVGFEMVIFSFGSGLDMEDTSPGNIDRFKRLADYAHSKGIRIGGYSLLASRRISDDDDVINPQTGKPGGAIFGNSPCLGSRWGIGYFERIKAFLTATGFDLLEHDGSYPGDVCASTDHPGHRGLDDSQWTQHQAISDFYAWCRERGLFLNVPDWYFLNGSNKSGMGYRETNWSLPRAQQHIHARQNLYDGTWQKTPGMGWMFTPLVEYQGGGAAATIEPLHEHLPDYELHLSNNLLYGAQACYRGPRLYDTPETRTLVSRWVRLFKEHRAILESDVIHLNRADGVHPDGVLHVNPTAEERGLAAFWNPAGTEVTADVEIPLYYTGLTETARVELDDGTVRRYRLDREYRIRIKLTLPARGVRWMTFR